jgi:protein-S-isoprenylcysteine O-methyltransferase Ste14
MVKLGNFLFKFRTLVFPLSFVALISIPNPVSMSGHWEKWRYVFGFAVALAGQAVRVLTIGLAYIKRGGKNRKIYANTLVKDGVFAHCRNPLYLGNILIVVGLAVIAHSIPFYFVGIPLFILMYVVIIEAEETYLRRQFGEEYTEYCRKVNRLIPNLSGIRNTIKRMEFHWSRVIVKEYGATYMWILCSGLLILRNQYARYGSEVNGSQVLIFCFGIAFMTLLYGIARYLKKSGRLTASDSPPHRGKGRKGGGISSSLLGILGVG